MAAEANIDFVPLKDFAAYRRPDRVAIGLRHDVDADIASAMKMARMEWEMNIPATYFVLHTAGYYGRMTRGGIVRRRGFLEKLRRIQDEWGHEIGFHNDLVTLQHVYKAGSREFLRSELEWLRANGMRIAGTAAHGSFFCRLLQYHNASFFKDFAGEDFVAINGEKRQIEKGYLREFDLQYEAYHLGATQYLSDCTFTGPGRRRWHPSRLEAKELRPGDKLVINIHPDTWASGALGRLLKPVSLLANSRKTIRLKKSLL
jgi:hypothetical protein